MVIPKHKRYTARYPEAIPQLILAELGTMKLVAPSVEFSQKGTFCMADARPGLSIMQAVIVPRSSMMPYMILVELEFLHDGQA